MNEPVTDFFGDTRMTARTVHGVAGIVLVFVVAYAAGITVGGVLAGSPLVHAIGAGLVVAAFILLGTLVIIGKREGWDDGSDWNRPRTRHADADHE